MINYAPFENLFTYLLDFLYITKNPNAYLPVHYIEDKNIIVYRTLKCAQTSVETALIRYSADLNQLTLSDSPKTFVGFVRDPFERAKSIIDMSLYNMQCFYGVKVDFRDFLDFTTCTDEHFLPQICFIPLRKSLNIGKYIPGEVNRFAHRQYNSWHNVTDVDMLDILSQSEDTYKFIRVSSDSDAVVDLYKHFNLGLHNLDLDLTQLNVGKRRYNNFIEPDRLVDITDPQFRRLVKTAYNQDIKFYNSVKCVND